LRHSHFFRRTYGILKNGILNSTLTSVPPCRYRVGKQNASQNFQIVTSFFLEKFFKKFFFCCTGNGLNHRFRGFIGCTGVFFHWVRVCEHLRQKVSENQIGSLLTSPNSMTKNAPVTNKPSRTIIWRVFNAEEKKISKKLL